MKIVRAVLAVAVCLTAVPAALEMLLASWSAHLPIMSAEWKVPALSLAKAINLALPCAAVAVLAGVLLLRVVPAGLVALAGVAILFGEYAWMGHVGSVSALRWASAAGGVGAGLALAGAGAALRAVDPVLSGGWVGLLAGAVVLMGAWAFRADITWENWRSVARPNPWLLAAALVASASFAIVDRRGWRGPIDPAVAWGLPVAGVLAALSVSLSASEDTAVLLIAGIAAVVGLLVAAVATRSTAALAGLAAGVLVPGVANSFRLTLPGRDGLGGVWQIGLLAVAAGVGAGLAAAGLRLAYPQVVPLVGLGTVAAGLVLLFPLWHRYGSLPAYLLVAAGAGAALAGGSGRRPGLGLGMALAGWTAGALLAGGLALWRGHVATSALNDLGRLSSHDRITRQEQVIAAYLRSAERWALGIALSVVVLMGLVVLAGLAARRTKP
jgi:hypothetical protein